MNLIKHNGSWGDAGVLSFVGVEMLFGLFFASAVSDRVSLSLPMLPQAVLAGFLIAILWYSRKRGVSIRREIGLDRTTCVRTVRRAIGYFVVLFFPILALHFAMYYFFGLRDPERSIAAVQTAPSFFQLCLFILTSLTVVPVVEEFISRSMLFNALKRRYGMVIGVLASSAIFAIGHWDLFRVPGLFVQGVGLALLYERGKNLGGPILLHAMFNLVPLLASLRRAVT